MGDRNNIIYLTFHFDADGKKHQSPNNWYIYYLPTVISRLLINGWKKSDNIEAKSIVTSCLLNGKQNIIWPVSLIPYIR